jgi:arylsulfatase A-like enzyme
VRLPPYYPDTPAVRADIARHYNNIAYMDGEVGDVLRQLEADGLADSTIVIWTTDHGDGLPRAKRELFDSGIRVPMIIRWPEAYRPAGFEPGTVDGRLISFVDLAPTILSLAGVPAPAYLHGSDFASDDFAREYIYASRDRIDEIVDRQRAVRDKRYKYLRSWYPGQPGGDDLAFRDNLDMVRQMRAMYDAGQLDAIQRQWYEAPGVERLYDLERDPHEVRDRSRDPAYHDIMSRLRRDMDSWLARVGDASEEPEAAMAARFEPGGERRVTPAPRLHREAGAVVISPAAPGHSLEYSVEDGPWELYVGPVTASPGQEVSARAVRYGWKESQIVTNP